MSVWDRLVGQGSAVEQLTRAAEDSRRIIAGDRTGRLAHSWLFTGPPGSGRSVAARSFAAALQCTGDPVGCGHCAGCRSSLAGANPDVSEVTTEAMTYRVGEALSWLELGYSQPSLGRWRVILVEDADRLPPVSSNVLLKALEEPPPRTVWMLCAPRADDLLPTIRSRCRQLTLATPSAEAVAQLLQEELAATPQAAKEAALIANNHIGLAKALVKDPTLRQSQVDTFMLALRVSSVGEAVVAAGRLNERARENGKERLGKRHREELVELREALGVPEGKPVPRPLQGQIRALEEGHKRQNRRALADELDRVMLDLLSFFRDTIVVQSGTPVALNNPDLQEDVAAWAERLSPREVQLRVEAIQLARQRLLTNVAPLLNLESLLISLYDPKLTI